VDVNTLQGEPFERVNMSNIKPHHEPLEANAYVLEVADTTNSSLGETIGNCTNGFRNTNYHNENSSESHDIKKPCNFYEGQKVICEYLPH
jgi:hypothetical protein